MALYLADEEHIKKLKRARKNKEHNDVLIGLWREFEGRFSIAHGRLPIEGNEKLLWPDFVFMDKKGSSRLEDRGINYIIEAETSGGRKSIPGAAVLADYCVKEHEKSGKQKSKPVLFFAVLKNKELAEKRIDSLEGYFGNVDVRVRTPEEVVEEIRDAGK